MRRDGRSWITRLNGEPDWPLDSGTHDPDLRAAAVQSDNLDLALVSMSSPLGVEALPPDEAEPLLEAYNDGVLELPGAFGTWGALGLTEPRAADVDRLLDRGMAGISVPAGAMAGPEGLAHCEPVLRRLEKRSAPLLVHPGPAPWGLPSPPSEITPAWWPPLTHYVAQMNAAWHAFIGWGRSRHPELRVVFAALAGGAPFHIERLASRGGPAADAIDPLVFYDTSSYGPRAIDAVVRCVGVDQLVHGSDRPLVEPANDRPLGDAAHEVMVGANPSRLLWSAPVAA